MVRRAVQVSVRVVLAFMLLAGFQMIGSALEGWLFQ